MTEPDRGGGAAAVDVTALDRRGPSGVVWPLPHGGDLDTNAVVIVPGGSVGAHVNQEVDVVLVVVAGRGAVEVDGEDVPLAAGRLVHVPKGASRAVRAAADDHLVYVTVHRARGGLAIGRRR